MDEGGAVYCSSNLIMDNATFVNNNAKKGGAKKQIIVLTNSITKEKLEFESKSECMEHFDVGRTQFSRWMKGETIKKMNGWKLETENESK